MHVVIMAGGSGTRFWPMSRRSRPKQFLRIVGDKPMVVATYERVRDLVGGDQVVIVVGRRHQAETERLFRGKQVRILVEPCARNTAPCIGLAAQCLADAGLKEPVAILPADHYIAQPERFRAALKRAAQAARQDAIVTLGIVPVRPETGYGYIQREPGGGDGDIFRVLRFVEKPSQERALEFLESGHFYWNAGIFVATPQTLLDEFRVHMSDFHRGLGTLGDKWQTPQLQPALSELYRGTEAISFDYAVMEKARHPVFVVPTDCGWSDVGSWYSLYEVREAEERDQRGNVTEGRVMTLDCGNSFVLSNSGRMVVILGLNGVLVVDTEDALMVADLQRSQEVRRVTSELKERGLSELL